MNEPINPYAPPQAELLTDQELAPGPPWFTVSLGKLFILNLLTSGAYGIYWFYQQWRCVRDRGGEAVTPWVRAPLYLIFAHGLFRRLDQMATHRGAMTSWAPRNLTIALFAAVIADRLADRVSPGDDVLLALLLMGAPTLIATVPLTLAQHTANRLNGDPNGSANAGPTAGALVVGTLGAMGWGITLWMIAVFGDLQQ